MSKIGDQICWDDCTGIPISYCPDDTIQESSMGSFVPRGSGGMTVRFRVLGIGVLAMELWKGKDSIHYPWRLM